MNEMLMFRNMMQMMGGGGQVWFSLGWLLCLMAVLLFRSEAIRHRGLYRWACTLFALSFIVPPVLEMGFYYYNSLTAGGGGMGAGFRGASESTLFMLLPSSTGPVLLGLSLIFGFAALAPTLMVGRAEPTSPPSPPPRHPLDDDIGDTP